MKKKYIMIMFYFICLISNFVININIGNHNDLKLINQFVKQSYLNIKINNDIDKYVELMKLIKNQENISLIQNNVYIGGYEGKAIYLKKFTYKIPMIDGVFFQDNDFDNNENKIVIGKDLAKLIYKYNGKKWIKVNGYNYEVIGIMGYKDNLSLLDKKFFINLNSYLTQENINLKDNIVLSFNNDELKNIIKKRFYVYYGNKSNYFMNLDINEYKKIIFIYGGIFFFMISNTIILGINYFRKKGLEIGIRRLYGANNFNIEIMIIREYFIASFISFLLASLTNILIIKIKIYQYVLGDRMFFETFIVTLVIIWLIAFIISFINIKRNNKKDICSLIREV